MDLIILDRNEKFIAPVRVYKPARFRQLNGEDTFTFITSNRNIKKGFRVLLPVSKTGVRTWKGYEYIVDSIVETHAGLSVVCMASIYELYTDYIERFAWAGTITPALNKLLERTRWELSQPVDFNAQNAWVYEDMSVRKALGEIQATTGLELDYEVEWNQSRVLKRKLWFTDKIGGNYGQTFEYGRNADNIERHISDRPIITKLYVYGAKVRPEDDKGLLGDEITVTFASINGGKSYLTNEKARELYGRIGANGQRIHSTSSVTFSDIEDPSLLLEEGTKYLEEVSKLSVAYTAKVVDFRQAGFEAAGVGLGDYVRVIDRELNINEWARVTGYHEFLDNESLNEIVLGIGVNPADEGSLYDSSTIADILNQIPKLADHKELQQSQLGIVENLLTHFNDQMNGALLEGEVRAFPGGFEFVNPDGTATQISSVGWRIANSKTSDGEWNWKTIATGDGLAANLIGAKQIIAGAINSDHIDTAGLDADVIRVGDNTLQSKLVRIDESSVRAFERLDSGETRLADLEADALTITDRVDSGETRMAKLEADQLTMSDDIGENTNQIATLNSKQLTLADGINDNSTQISTLNSQQLTLADDIGKNASQITTLSNNKLSISEWNNAKQGIDSDIDSVERSLSTLDGEVTNIAAGHITLSESTEGEIAGMNLSYKGLRFDGPSAKFSISVWPGNSYFMYAGTSWSDSKFVVHRDGSLYAKGADISGTFKGNTATLGTWQLNSSSISSYNSLRRVQINATQGTGNDFFTFNQYATSPHRSARLDSLCELHCYAVKENSDCRLKTNIQEPSDRAKSLALEAEIIEFEWKDQQGQKQLGVIAQQIEEIYPEAVSEDEHGIKSVDYKQIALSTTLEVQKLRQEVDELKELVGQLLSERRMIYEN